MLVRDGLALATTATSSKFAEETFTGLTGLTKTIGSPSGGVLQTGEDGSGTILEGGRGKGGMMLGGGGGGGGGSGGGGGGGGGGKGLVGGDQILGGGDAATLGRRRSLSIGGAVADGRGHHLTKGSVPFMDGGRPEGGIFDLDRRRPLHLERSKGTAGLGRRLERVRSDGAGPA